MKTLSNLIAEIEKEYEETFGKRFNLWSGYGWWLQKMKVIAQATAKAMEVKKISIKKWCSPMATKIIERDKIVVNLMAAEQRRQRREWMR